MYRTRHSFLPSVTGLHTGTSLKSDYHVKNESFYCKTFSRRGYATPEGGSFSPKIMTPPPHGLRFLYLPSFHILVTPLQERIMIICGGVCLDLFDCSARRIYT
jgi:hypothetical protein